ncbi:MAG: hypothetical protein M1527_00820 [Gammaproteobacteria bacterium]|nr:hypothetical protein [Gammaproteobacteria bacterium]
MMKENPEMKIRPNLVWLAAPSVFLAMAGSLAMAQTENPRAAFERAMMEVNQSAKGSVAEQQAMERAIAAANRVSPKPAVPDAVVDHVGRAEAAAQSAKSPRDFLDAAEAYGEAMRLAPWVAEYHFNRGIVLEKAEHYDAAEAAFQLYLKAAPKAQDAAEVRKKIAGLRYLKEKAARPEQDQGAASEKEGLLRSLNGLYYNDGDFNVARTTSLMGHSTISAIMIANGKITCGSLVPHNSNFPREEGFFPSTDGGSLGQANTSVALDDYLITFCDNTAWCPTGAETGYKTSWSVILAKDGKSLKMRTTCPSRYDYWVYQRH